MRFLAALALVLLLIGTGAFLSYLVPWRYLPWEPLDVAEEPEPAATALKMARLSLDRRYCEAALATAGLHVTPRSEVSAKGCVLHDVVEISGDNPAFSSRFIATCPLAVAMAMFVRHEVEPAAERDLHTSVVTVDHLGSFACRDIVGGHGHEGLSEHAAANAVDISGFVLRDGGRVTVQKNWHGADDKAQFLHDVRVGACRYFHTVLSPDYNAAHQSHLHLDMGLYRMCR